MWGGLVDYSHYTGDTSYDSVIAEAIYSQASPTMDFMMANQRFDLGNDDQVFWALTAMSAAEYDFPVASGAPSTLYFDLARNTFNDLVERWNTTQCDGGLKWQFYPENNGYDYKSSIANGGFFQLGARLARFTGNVTYVEWADKTYNWMTSVDFLNSTYSVRDGAGDLDNCSVIGLDTWSYNAATMIYGSAVLWNVSQAQKWDDRTKGLIATSNRTFFGPFSNATGVMYEQVCERTGSCNTDEFSFKAYLSRWMGKATLMSDGIKDGVDALLAGSAAAAAKSCSGEAKGTTCGTKWYVDGWDGTKGLGQQLSALETIQSLLAGANGLPGTQDGVKLPAGKV